MKAGVFLFSFIWICILITGESMKYNPGKPEDLINSDTTRLDGIIGFIELANEIQVGDSVIFYTPEMTAFTRYMVTQKIPIYRNFSFPCTSVNKSKYHIQFNSSPAVILRDNSLVRLVTWEEHIMEKVGSISPIDPSVNKVHNEPDESAVINDRDPFTEDDQYLTVEIKGDWIKVKWGWGESDEPPYSGWLRWKKDGKLIVEFYYWS